jgi:hypothetical protein
MSGGRFDLSTVIYSESFCIFNVGNSVLAADRLTKSAGSRAGQPFEYSRKMTLIGKTR